jgi:hypothetical protein
MVDRGFYMSNIFTDATVLDMGVFAPHGRFVHLYLNGSYWGLYHLRERWAAEMMSSYYGGRSSDYESINGTLNVGGWADPGLPYDNGTGAMWTEMKARALSGGDVYGKLRPLVDVPQYVDYMTMWMFGKSEDEYRLTGPTGPGHGGKFMLNDADGYLYLAAYGGPGSDRTGRSTPGKSAGDGPGSVFSMLYRDGGSDYRMLLADRIQRAFVAPGGAMTPAANAARLTELCAGIEKAMIPECARWNYRTPPSWTAARDGALNWFLGSRVGSSATFTVPRTTTVLGHYTTAGFYPAVAAPVANPGPGVVAAGVIVAIASIYPLYFWLLGWSHGLPIWPVFVASNGILAALPMIQDSENLAVYTPGEIIIGGMTFVGFFALGTVIWLSLTGRQRKPPEAVLMISREHSERYLFVFVVLGLLFYLNQLAWIIPFPGNTMQIARGITGALSTLGIFVLAFYDGQGLLKRFQSVLLAVLATLTALAGAAGLIMATAIVPVAMLMMGYALGSGKVPWKSLAAVLLVAAILHPGKFAMRQLYWGPDRPAFRLTMLPQFYADWFGYGIDQVSAMTGVGQKLTEEEVESSLFERSGVLHMLLLVQKKRTKLLWQCAIVLLNVRPRSSKTVCT